MAFLIAINAIDAQNVGIGTQNPTAKLEVNGQVKITGGSPGANKVLTSDASGLGSWQTPVSEFAYIYNLSPTLVVIEADVPFDSNGNITSGLIHVIGSSSIYIVNTGMYKVNFSVTAIEPNQFTLFLNGGPVAGSTYGSGAGTQQNNSQAIIIANAGDILTLRNHSTPFCGNVVNLCRWHRI